MEYRIVSIAWIIISSYFFAGLATTIIVRLTKGNTASVLESVCRCPNCGYIIPLYHQLPIISHMFSKGRCRSCGGKIPTIQLYLEIIVFLVCVIIGIVCDFSKKAFPLMGIAFFVLGFIVLLLYGRRQKRFGKQVLLASLMLIVDVGLFYFVGCMLEFFSKET